MALRIHSILQRDPDPGFDTDIVLVGNFLGSGSFLKLDRDPDPSQTVRGQKSFPPFPPLFASFSAFLGGTRLNTDRLLLYIRRFIQNCCWVLTLDITLFGLIKIISSPPPPQKKTPANICGCSCKEGCGWLWRVGYIKKLFWVILSL